MHMEFIHKMPMLWEKTLQVGWKIGYTLGFQRPTYYLLKQETFKFEIFIYCVCVCVWYPWKS
jgi:hypothetical protein